MAQIKLSTGGFTISGTAPSWDHNGSCLMHENSFRAHEYRRLCGHIFDSLSPSCSSQQLSHIAPRPDDSCALWICFYIRRNLVAISTAAMWNMWDFTKWRDISLNYMTILVWVRFECLCAPSFSDSSNRIAETIVCSVPSAHPPLPRCQSYNFPFCKFWRLATRRNLISAPDSHNTFYILFAWIFHFIFQRKTSSRSELPFAHVWLDVRDDGWRNLTGENGI